ncbi:exosortase F system-associated protein [Flavobacteriaceae bacterium S0825]|uniref:exosortase F system-associated membrane protein n=1 Tax=Gaetbulibacter sp. S0825 TaxID=2720084 RepID=UPI001432098C|nr:exosortase F system-associated protein [Gaetbulibacter sp. S0825]MCK0108658.1 exosortase F system-associated protein [Flavobacteriaceae bacterium S0825]NIX64294.1 exosortase F system-associated protein [Gaetbulibacter sp. S0825]
MHKWSKYIFVFVLILLLALIRYFEDYLFYDPYLQFFENDYLYIDSPRREALKLTLFTTLRYVLNTVISLGILYVVFKDKSVVKFSVIIYGIAYLFLLAAFLYFVINPKQEEYYLFFNIRRFLIQPLILVVLLPAFYYNKIRR